MSLLELLGLLLLATAPHERPTDSPWPDYRGPRFDGTAPGSAVLPLEFGEDRAVRWKTEIPGRGWSSPVVAGDLVWLTSANDTGERRFAMALDLEHGFLMQTHLLFQVAEPEFRNALNSYASPSPVIGGGRVFLHFGTVGTVALDAKSGEELWRRDDLHCEHLMGPGSSPVLFDDLVILTLDGADVQRTVALDVHTGATRWDVPRNTDFSSVIPDQRKAYGTPLLVGEGEHAELISTGAQRTIAYDPHDGRARWWVDHVGYSMSARPVLVDEGRAVVVNTAYDRPRYVCIERGGEGDVTATHVRWTFDKGVPTMSSAVVAGDRMFFVSEGGVASCVDVHSGELVWKERIEGQHSASPLRVGERIYFFDRQGGVVVLRAADTFEKLAANRLDAGFMASPAVVGDALLLRTETHLYRIEAPADGGP